MKRQTTTGQLMTCLSCLLGVQSHTLTMCRKSQCNHDHAYLIETESGRQVSCNRHDIGRSHLTFVPNLPEPHLKPQSVKAEKSNPGSAPVGVKQANPDCPTARHPVSGANSQSTSGLVT